MVCQLTNGGLEWGPILNSSYATQGRKSRRDSTFGIVWKYKKFGGWRLIWPANIILGHSSPIGGKCILGVLDVTADLIFCGIFGAKYSLGVAPCLFIPFWFVLGGTPLVLAWHYGQRSITLRAKQLEGSSFPSEWVVFVSTWVSCGGNSPCLIVCLLVLVSPEGAELLFYKDVTCFKRKNEEEHYPLDEGTRFFPCLASIDVTLSLYRSEKCSLRPWPFWLSNWLEFRPIQEVQWN